MRALIVGLGSIGRRHARNWSALGYGPPAVCHQRNAPQPEQLGIEAREYWTWTQALEREQPDVVLVTNPTSLHVPVARQAIDAGAHVLVEKPLASSTQSVAELLEAARARRRALMAAYNLRFHPGLARMRELAQQQAIGRIVSARADAGEYLPDWHPWEDYRQGYSARADLGGGAVLTFSHELDALCWLAGRARTVTARVAHASSLEIDVEDIGRDHPGVRIQRARLRPRRLRAARGTAHHRTDRRKWHPAMGLPSQSPGAVRSRCAAVAD